MRICKGAKFPATLNFLLHGLECFERDIASWESATQYCGNSPLFLLDLWSMWLGVYSFCKSIFPVYFSFFRIALMDISEKCCPV